MTLRITGIILATTLMLTIIEAHVHAQICQSNSATEQTKQAAIKYLRRLSLDLQGKLPTYEQQLKAYNDGYVSNATIDGMLRSNEFVGQMREFFKDLLTINIEDLRLANSMFGIGYKYLQPNGNQGTAKTGIRILDNSSKITRQSKRGRVIGCLPNQKAEYNGKGELLCYINGKVNNKIPCKDAYPKPGKGINFIQEGYINTKVYWDEQANRQWKVCALAANKNATVKDSSGKIHQCSNEDSHLLRTSAHSTRYCGCGPELQWCIRTREYNSGVAGWQSMNLEYIRSMMEQSIRLIDNVVRNDRPYTDLLLTQTAEVNGPLSFLLNRGTGVASLLEMAGHKQITVPDFAYHQQTTWKSFSMGARGAGLLTLPFYSLKYSTNRSRYHRFRTAFACAPFVAPSTNIPSPTDSCHDEPNLTKRCMCKHCHVDIEPNSAHWGRWKESSWFPIDPKVYPSYDKSCDRNNGGKPNNTRCRKFYKTTSTHDSDKGEQGKLLPFVFGNKNWDDNMAAGPAKLVREYMASGQIARCGVRNMWQWFVGSDLQAVASQSSLLNTLANQFKAGNRYSMRDLIKTIVTSEEYRHGFATNRP